MSVLSGLNLEKLKGLSPEAKKTVHNNEVSVLSGLNLEKVKGLSLPGDKENCP